MMQATEAARVELAKKLGLLFIPNDLPQRQPGCQESYLSFS